MSRCPLVFVLTATLVAGGALLAADDQGPPASANAALKYWTGFGAMPRLDKDQEKLLDDVAAAPLNDATRKLVEAAGQSLLYLHRGAALPQCDWALNMEDGVYLVLPHLSKARELSKLACLRARVFFAADRAPEGINDVFDSITLARRIAQEPTTMIAIMVEFSIERDAFDTLAAALPKLSAAQRADITARLTRLPPAGDVRACLKTEKKYYLDWVVARLRAAPAGTVKSELANMFASPEGEAQDIRELLKPLSDAEVLRQVEAVGGVYDEFIRLMEQPRDQFATGSSRLDTRLREQMPLAIRFLPAVNKLMEAQERQEAYRALFRAALAVTDGGPDRLKDAQIRDPFGTGPFEYRARPQGFELQSKLLFRGEPVKLVVGPR